MRRLVMWLLVTGFGVLASQAAIVNVPEDFKTIQAAIDAAADGDTVLIAPGEYKVNETTVPQKRIEQVAHLVEIEDPPGLLIIDKEIMLGSRFIFSADSSDIWNTVINGGAYVEKDEGWEGGTAITTAGSKTVSIKGLTITRADDGIYAGCRLNLTYCHIYETHDGVDYESGSGGYCAFNLIERNTDDALDFDEDIDIVCEYNTLRNNDDDGIEIRLQPWNGHTLYYYINNNVITGNAEDGIQFIGYNVPTNRVFDLRHNLFARNEIAGIACMNDSNTVEDLRGSQLTERIIVKYNIFIDNPYGIVGGGNILVKDNTIANCAEVPLMHIRNESEIRDCMLWNNAKDPVDCNVTKTSFFNLRPHPEGRPGLNAKWPVK